MAKPEWGIKRTGPCGTKFYDFNKNPIICPGCGGEVITNKVKTKIKKNEVEEKLKNNSKENTLNEDNSKGINILDNSILDNEIINDEIINDEVSIDDPVDNELEENISNDDINLIDGENDIVLDVEIDEDDK